MGAIMSTITGRGGAKRRWLHFTDGRRAAGDHEGPVPRMRVARSWMEAALAKPGSPGHHHVWVAPSGMLLEPISMLNTSPLLSDMVISVAETYESSLVH